MRILHICSYYIGNKLYQNLIKQLFYEGIDQEIFIPIKDKSLMKKNQLPPCYLNVNYYYRDILRPYDKFLYHNKIKKQFRELEGLIEVNRNLDFVHAHTIFSDGGTAYKLYEKYGVDYLVNVRNTDINSFYKYAIHLRPFMYKVLINAKAIVFIAYSYREKMLEILPKYVVSNIKDKCYVIPNGIDDYWLENSIVKLEGKNSNIIKLLYIGTINKNKNLKTLILVCSKLIKEDYKVILNIIGSGPLENECKNLSKKLRVDKYVIFHGYVENKKSISSIMDECDIFIMPSFKETFGLVYIEAMSRGLPIIYTENQGIDGFFKEGEVGFSVNPSSVQSIEKAIKNIKKNYRIISVKCHENSKKFNWKEIAKKYRNIYEQK